jgi:predicted RNase H-like HicB family nuclease
MTDCARLLTPPYNFALVQLPERQYPGVVFQGDTLHSILADVGEMQKLLVNRELAQLSEELQSLLEKLSAIQNSYEHVCFEQGLGLPYPR